MSEEYESPYCEVCGTCGYIGCCGIRNFIEEHIKGKTNCKNEDLIISELISLCECETETQQENQQLKSVLNEVRDRIQDDIKGNEDLYLDTPFIIEHENSDLYDYLKILDKVGGFNE